MKKILSLAILFTGISVATFAQDKQQAERPVKQERKHARQERRMENRTPEEMAQMKTDRLDQELRFTDAQRKEVYAIQLDQAKRQYAHRAEMKQLQQKWREETKVSQNKLSSVLSAEQQSLLKEKFVHGRKEKMMRKPGGFKGKSKTEVMPQKEVEAAG